MRRQHQAFAERGLGAAAALLTVVNNPLLPLCFGSIESRLDGRCWLSETTLGECRARP